MQGRKERNTSQTRAYQSRGTSVSMHCARTPIPGTVEHSRHVWPLASIAHSIATASACKIRRLMCILLQKMCMKSVDFHDHSCRWQFYARKQYTSQCSLLGMHLIT